MTTAMTHTDFHEWESSVHRNPWYVMAPNSKWLGKDELPPQYVDPPKHGVASEGYGTHGKNIDVAPWSDETYSIPQEFGEWETVLGLEKETLPDLGMDVAMFYLLQGIVYGGVHSGMETALRYRDREVARARRFFLRQLQSLSKKLARPLRQYALGAIGGECRHHKAIGGFVLSMHRKSAWAGFSMVCDQIGTEKALEGAVEIFNDFAKGSSYGGKKWATCAETLLMYERGELSDVGWIDRVINLQHNTGSFLNKITWPNRTQGNTFATSLELLTNSVIPEHAMDFPRWRNFQNWAEVEVLEGWFDLVNQALVRCGEVPKQNPYVKTKGKHKVLDAYTARLNARKAFQHYRLRIMSEHVSEDSTPENLASYEYCKETMAHSMLPLKDLLGMSGRFPVTEACRRYGVGHFRMRETMMVCPGHEDWDFGPGPYTYDAMLDSTTYLSASRSYEVRWQRLVPGEKISLSGTEWKYLTQAEWFLLLAHMDASNLYLRGWGNAHTTGYVLSPKKPKKELVPYVASQEVWSEEAQGAVTDIWTQLLQEDPDFK